jgi:hypothetical protein
MLCTKLRFAFSCNNNNNNNSIATSALKMVTVYFSKTLASTYKSIWRQNPEHHHHRRENVKSEKDPAIKYLDMKQPAFITQHIRSVELCIKCILTDCNRVQIL